MRDIFQIAKLLAKYLTNSLDKKEKNKLDRWLNKSEDNKNYFVKVTDPDWLVPALQRFNGINTTEAWERFGKRIYKNQTINNYEENKKLIIITEPEIVADSRIINSSLVNIIRNDPYFIHSIEDRQFEFLVAELFEKEGYKVTPTPQTWDGGKDIFILEKKIVGTFLYYVECKKNSPERPVGVRVVRELFGTITKDRATAGIIVTSSFFTKGAKDFVDGIQHQMSLIDFLQLIKWISDLK